LSYLHFKLNGERFFPEFKTGTYASNFDEHIVQYFGADSFLPADCIFALWPGCIQPSAPLVLARRYMKLID
jgi:hypothetical protein